MTKRKTATPDLNLLAYARALQAAGDRPRAADAFALLYYEFPFSDLAAVAATELDDLRDLRPARESTSRFNLDLGRAGRLFASKRYAAARSAYEALQPIAGGDDAELVDHYLRRFAQSRDQLARYLNSASRKAEARFFYLTAVREIGDRDEFVQRSRALAADFPDSSWAEEALNNLATHFIVTDDDEAADAVFRELYAKFPQGAHAERAAWKAGWWAYKHGRYQETISFYEGAAATFPRSDLRPGTIIRHEQSRPHAVVRHR